MEKIKVEQKDLYILLMSELRYAMERDNHLAPFTFIHMYKKYINEFETELKDKIIAQVKSEISFNLELKKYDYHDFWTDFLETA